jgi:trehalose 6-phosphate phosphatase
MRTNPSAPLDLHAPLPLPAGSERDLLLAFDFDGTLAPLVRTRDDAAMREATAVLFAAVCARYPTAVISGRARADVASRLGPSRPTVVIGNHGAEDERRSPIQAATVARLMRRAIALLQPLTASRLDLEDKYWSLALHVGGVDADRRVPERLVEVEHALAELGPRVRVSPGHKVVNVVPTDAPHKGIAVRRLKHQLGARHVLYVGDDVTDEDVFQLAVPWLTGVRIGYSPQTAAAYFLPVQHDIDALLACLVRDRPLAPMAPKPR